MPRHPDWLPPALDGLDHDAGWDGLVRLVVAYAVARDLSLLHIKEKDGVLRIYAADEDPVLDTLVELARQQSAAMCECCGAPGILRRSDAGLLKTLCDEHAAAHAAERRQRLRRIREQLDLEE